MQVVSIMLNFYSRLKIASSPLSVAVNWLKQEMFEHGRTLVLKTDLSE